MNIGTQIKKFRKLKGLTQKEFGLKLGFPEGTADIRVAQYESGSRTPKECLIKKMAKVLEVSPGALTVPNVSVPKDVCQLLFALEDECGLRAEILENKLCLSIGDYDACIKNSELVLFLSAWKVQADNFSSGTISREEYDKWRYNFAM